MDIFKARDFLINQGLRCGGLKGWETEGGTLNAEGIKGQATWAPCLSFDIYLLRICLHWGSGATKYIKHGDYRALATYSAEKKSQIF